MKALRMYGKNDMRLQEVEVPSIGEGDILVRVKSVGICGTDLRILNNGMPHIDESHPRILGHEFSGLIERVGSRVEKYGAGMRVAVAPNLGCQNCRSCHNGDVHLCKDYRALGVQLDGGFAEFVRIPEEAVLAGNVMRIPDQVGFDEASINEALSCVYNGFTKCTINRGDRVLVMGAGPIGIMTAQLAKSMGASMVIISNRSVGRLEICNKLDSSFITVQADQLRARIEELTNGEGVEVCITANPSPEAQAEAVELMALNGRINFFGGLPKDRQLVSINTNLIHYKQLMVTGTTKANNEHFRTTMDMIASGKLQVKPLITGHFELDNHKAAFESAASSTGIKTVFSFE
jgi:L-iditol 2-dehydrogenase